MWDQWLDSTATVHRLSHGSQGSYKAPTVTWAQSLPALTSKVVEPRTFYPLYPYLCCGLVTCRMCLYVPKEKNFLEKPGSLLISYIILETKLC